ncbi:MAG TPA: putative baseplate assembly protein, partial [Coleofasciculaceae cyanobacterium]
VQGLQPNQPLIVSGKRIQAQVETVGGIFRAMTDDRFNSIQWQRQNQGLTNLHVQTLVLTTHHHLWVGTPSGVFRSSDLGQTWEPLNHGLTNPDIRVLLAYCPDNPPAPGEAALASVIAGTADGVFQWVEGESAIGWQPLSQGLTHRSVQAITLKPDGTLFVGTSTGGVFRANRPGSPWTATGLTNTDIQALSFIPTSGWLLAGTANSGIFRSADDGITWQAIFDTRPVTGTFTSDGTLVTGNSPDAGQELQRGDSINALGQTRTLLAIDRPNLTLTIDAPFRPDLPAGTPLSFNTGLSNRHITALAIADNGDIFAGTAGSGIFRSTDGDRWQSINDNLTDLEIRCLTIHPVDQPDQLDQFKRQEYLWAGTATGGVFQSTNHGDRWFAVNTQLSNTDIRAIAAADSMLFAGGVGMLMAAAGSYSVEVRQGDILQVLTPPVADAQGLQAWTVMNRDGFVGQLMTSASTDLTLLPADPDSDRVSEAVQISKPPDDQQHPVLLLTAPLRYSYDPATVEIYGNVVAATHGEAVEAVLGSGEGTIANQKFVLRQPPLTYVPAANARGSESTLQVRVKGVLWQEAPSLYLLPEQSQSYIVRLQDDGTPVITFGDGINGSRLPSGQENITASYRSGIGVQGNLGIGRLSLLKTRPLGITAVTNPLPATGAADPESRDQARAKAPPSVRTLDRIVSLRDFEDFTRAFAGIGKAQAVALWTGESQVVHLTIAAVGGATVLPESSLYDKLVAAINQARDPLQQVQVQSYEPLLFNLEAQLLIDPRYETDQVLASVEAALLDTFAFEKRQFHQPVTASEAIAAIQKTEGIIAVDLDALYHLGFSRALEQSLLALPARYDLPTHQPQAAQLLLINPNGIKLTLT